MSRDGTDAVLAHVAEVHRRDLAAVVVIGSARVAGRAGMTPIMPGTTGGVPQMIPTMMTDAELSKQAYRLLSELVRLNRMRVATAIGMVPVRRVSISREDGKPTLVVA